MFKTFSSSVENSKRWKSRNLIIKKTLYYQSKLQSIWKSTVIKGTHKNCKYKSNKNNSSLLMTIQIQLSTIPPAPLYGVNWSQLIRYARAWSHYTSFIYRSVLLWHKLAQQSYEKKTLFLFCWGRVYIIIRRILVFIHSTFMYLFMKFLLRFRLNIVLSPIIWSLFFFGVFHVCLCQKSRVMDKLLCKSTNYDDVTPLIFNSLSISSQSR